MLRVHFGRHSFDSKRHLLEHDGTRLHLTRKAFLLLELLIEQRPSVVSKRQIVDRLWSDCVVSEGGIASLISEIRAALGPGATAIRTVHGVGYAFVAEAGDLSPKTTGADARGFLLIERGTAPRSVDLFDGAIVIGRGLDCDVRIPSTTVSRNHARIRLARESAILEDLESRNGTYLRGKKVTGPVPLADGDAIRVGMVEMVFRTAAPAESETEPAPSSGSA